MDFTPLNTIGEYYLADFYRQNMMANMTDMTGFQSVLDANMRGYGLENIFQTMLHAGVQSRLQADSRNYSVVVPAALQDKLASDPKLSQSIMEKISALLKAQDSVSGSVSSCSITLDEEGNISNYGFYGGKGQSVKTAQTERKNSGDTYVRGIKGRERAQRLSERPRRLWK